MTEPGTEYADTAEHTQSLAGSIASAAAQSMEHQLQEGAEGSQSPPKGQEEGIPAQGTPEGQEGFEGEPEGVEGQELGEGEEGEEAEGAEEGEEGEEEQVSPELSQLQGLHESLQQQGVSLDLDLEDLDPELYEPATRLMDAAYQKNQDYLSKASELDEARLGYEGLMQRLEKQPEQILLAIALDKPDVFSKAAQLYSEMQESEDVKNQVVREVETAARQANVDRREQQMNEQQVRVLASQIEGEISRQCRLKGLDEAQMTSFVEKEIKLARAEGRVFNPTAVSELADSLRPKAPTPKPPKHVKPKRHKKTKETPNASVSGSSAPGKGGEAPGHDTSFPDHEAHGMRSLVRDAFKKTFKPER